MNELSDQEIQNNNNVVTNFVCLTNDARKISSADYIIWMNTIDQGRFEPKCLKYQKPRD